VSTVTINVTLPYDYTPPSYYWDDNIQDIVYTDVGTAPTGLPSGTCISQFAGDREMTGPAPRRAFQHHYGTTRACTTETLDLNNNNLVINYDPASNPLGIVRGRDSKRPFHGGSWDGAGLTSSMIVLYPAARSSPWALSDNNSPGNQISPFDDFVNQFEGAAVNLHSVLVKFHLAGRHEPGRHGDIAMLADFGQQL